MFERVIESENVVEMQGKRSFSQYGRQTVYTGMLGDFRS